MVVLFDIGRVLAKRFSLQLFIDYANLDIDIYKLRDAWQATDFAIDFQSGRITLEEYIEKFNEYLNINITAEDFKDYYFGSQKREWFDSTLRIVKNLKEQGIKVGVLSNLMEVDWEAHNSIGGELFDYKFLSYEIGSMKPEDKIYEYVTNELKGQEIYFFDDREENVEAAIKHGINAYVATGETILELDIVKKLMKIA